MAEFGFNVATSFISGDLEFQLGKIFACNSGFCPFFLRESVNLVHVLKCSNHRNYSTVIGKVSD